MGWSGVGAMVGEGVIIRLPRPPDKSVLAGAGWAGAGWAEAGEGPSMPCSRSMLLLAGLLEVGAAGDGLRVAGGAVIPMSREAPGGPPTVNQA